MVGKQNLKLMHVSDNLNVQILPHSDYEYLMTTQEVAKGYGISVQTLRSHKSLNKDELKENTHFVKGVENFNALAKNTQPHQVFWTKAGVVRLGFFIKSERAKLFRDFAEKIVLQSLSTPQPVKQLPAAPKRRHNRLTEGRIISIMADICLIEDKELRTRIANKLLQEVHNG